MNLSDSQVTQYQHEGYLLLESLLSDRDLDAVKGELPALYAEDSPRRVLERDGRTVRSVYAPHTTSHLLRRLASHEDLLVPVMQLLEGDVYVHQYKINVKAGCTGDIWDWHQDYIFWLNEDGMREPRAVNVVLFLDEVNEFNGPLMIVPRTHHELIRNGDAADADDWASHLAADLKYSIDKSTMQALVGANGLAAPKGSPGTVLFFHPSAVHGSGGNLYPFDRSVAILTYNRVDNIPSPSGKRRPTFLVADDYTPLEPLPRDECLVSPAAVV